MSPKSRNGLSGKVMRGESLNLTIHLKPQDSLRPPQILALQHAAILQLQRIGKADPR